MKYLFVILLGSLTACNISFKKKVPQMEAYNEILQTDAAFAVISGKEGFKRASLEFMEPDAILLKTNRWPVAGAEVVALLTSLPDSSFALSWKAEGAFVAESCDLGYSYGGYEFKMADKNYQGSYVLIWKKQTDGSWKYSLGNLNDAFVEVPAN